MAHSTEYPKLAQFADAAALAARCAELGLNLPVDKTIETRATSSPLADSLQVGSVRVGNRWCIQPMEGWDGQIDGSPGPLTIRRWENFGRSGAKLIWGGEAAAVCHAGRANPHQLLAVAGNRPGLEQLLATLRDAHQQRYGTTVDLLVGLQLTHSGRFSQPNVQGRPEPQIAYHHPLLDEKFQIDANDSSVVLTDDALERIIDDYVAAAQVAYDVGFQFVDVKACHGYLIHELLSARRRSGPFGGDLAGRSRMLLTIIDRLRMECPNLMVGARLSAFDTVPFQAGDGVGKPMPYEQWLPYDMAFGTDPSDPLSVDLAEPFRLLTELADRGVSLINLSCGSPYYNPHIQRPASYPPSDGYLPPEDPLIGVWRQIDVVRQVKSAFPRLTVVGSGYSYLQDFLPHVAQAVIREGWADFIGVGRMVLAYPELPDDVLTLGRLQKKRVCRTFSDCTTAPRGGLPSGCYPLDPYYKKLPEREQLRDLKAQPSKRTN